ncbi:hypothetical protein BS47DRAFT_1349465 [Hydnum rufescens UP504]|uniref:Protein YOP1 n=1 Tax=Hydnum rufescens UP504 TaxID=1448309 RepID=A0A9P6ANR9_9AGAM|nr:hypothetical protein BS47DRAFT_1349465 [Hydnum rufescens UP504]
MSPIISSTDNFRSSAVVYLYPSYATFKSLRHEPGQNRCGQVVRTMPVDLLAYWCIIGAFVAFEASLEWLIRWFPFYTEIKTLFLVFLSQGGSGFVYKELLAPRYALYEPPDRRASRSLQDTHDGIYSSKAGGPLLPNTTKRVQVYTAAGRRAALLATGAGYFGGAGSPHPRIPSAQRQPSPSANESSGAHRVRLPEGYSLNGDL